MRKILFLALGFFGLSVSPVRAQELPAGDLSVGYSYLREGFNNGVNANGGGAALAGYVNRWLGITGDFGAYHAAPFGIVGSACHSRRQRCFRFDEWICLECRRRN
jgi:hypothetical protein